MQSGISASEELHTAFKSFLSSPDQRGLLASISKNPESLVPAETIPSTSSEFLADLAQVPPRLSPTAAAYVILKKGDGPGGCVAVTYVPDGAPVRQKMLFAATRLTLVRELGTEHFSSTLFATTADELSAAGWERHEAHGSLSAPLTEAERDLEDIREAEAQESTGTGARRGGHVRGVSMPCDEDVLDSLRRLNAGELALVQIEIDIQAERLTLASTHPPPLPPSALQTTISASSPRYSFYAYASTGPPDAQRVLFIYTCPGTATVKQKMLYASQRLAMIKAVAPSADVEVAGKLEASGPDEISEEMVKEEMETAGAANGDASGAGAAGAAASAGAGQNRGFARPKRPGKR